jgi:hypothetical protein
MNAPAICRTLCANTTDLGSSAGTNTHYNRRNHRTQNCAHCSWVQEGSLQAYTK